MRQVRFSEGARGQLLGIARYLFERTGDDRAGEKFVREIEARILRVGASPSTLGRPRPDLGTNLRSLPHKGYLIFFAYEGERTDVLHVVHSRRDLKTYFASKGGDD